MRNSLIVCFIIVSSLAFSQRGKTGDKTFADRFPQDALTLSSASLKMVNEVDHDIIVLVRDQEKKFLQLIFQLVLIQVFQLICKLSLCL